MIDDINVLVMIDWVERPELRQVKIVWGLEIVSRRSALGDMMDERNKSE